MTIRDERILRRTLESIIYGALERFISDHVTAELEKNSVQVDKNALLQQSEKIVKRAVDKAINELKKNGLTSLEALSENPDLVDNLMTKIQDDMISDAESV